MAGTMSTTDHARLAYWTNLMPVSTSYAF
uniref:Uncharacterized protein n=1 Tax=Arundo donax TaxID=35708 RepID=A0A0A9FLY7_ARUDO